MSTRILRIVLYDLASVRQKSLAKVLKTDLILVHLALGVQSDPHAPFADQCLNTVYHFELSNKKAVKVGMFHFARKLP